MEYLKAILSSLAPYSLDVLLVTVVVGLISFLIMSIKNKTGFNIAFGPFKFSLGNKNNTMNSMSFINDLLEFQEDHIRSIFQIETSLLKKQMNYTEQKLLEVKFHLCEAYANILSKKLTNGEDIKLHRDYRFYQRITTMLIKEVADNIFYPAFSENHFETMSEDVWYKYVNDKALYVLNFGDDLLGTLYEDAKAVSRKEASDSERESVPKTKEVVKAIFDMARTYAINSKKEIDELRIKSKEEIKKICFQHGLNLDESQKDG